MKKHIWKNLDSAARARLLRRPGLEQNEQLQTDVAAILRTVREGGDQALSALTLELDGITLSDFLVDENEFAAAAEALTNRQHEAIEAAAANIRAFHQAQLSEPVIVETTPGVVCERVTRPIKNVGLYVPAGSAPLPSTALMLAIPAAIAGCDNYLMCTPPQQNGSAHPAVLVAAKICGVQRVFKLGGAQAIAAMAYGTATIPKVQKIFGPGNTWVTTAKAQVSQDPQGAACDMPAGPSEVLVIADDNANPSFIASDLLSQAEHGPDSQVILIGTSASICDKTLTELETQQANLSRRDIVVQSLANSAAIIVDNLDIV